MSGKRKREETVSTGDKKARITLNPVEQDYTIDSTWVTPSSLRNYLMRDPLIDWLKHHSASFSVANPDVESAVSRAIKEPHSMNSFTEYIMSQGREFEDRVMKLYYDEFGPDMISEIGGELNAKSKEKVLETLQAMNKGVPIIHSGLLHDPVHKIYGVPDLLVRSDWLHYIVKCKHLTREQRTIQAPNLTDVHNPSQPPNYHYVVVDIKFSTLSLRADGIHLLNSGSIPAYKGQVWAYNEALGLLQGYKPKKAYLLGRKWTFTSKGEKYRGTACFDRLGEVDFDEIDNDYSKLVVKAADWIRDVRTSEAKEWNVFTVPLPRSELYPNMCNGHDYPWRPVKERIAHEIKELTLLWMVGTKQRDHAHKLGIYQWTDPRCNVDSLGFKGETTRRILSKIIDINQKPLAFIKPRNISSNMMGWKAQREIEFYVDFETINDVLTDFDNLPEAEPSSMIFMIGVGYIDPDTKAWVYRDFTVDSLTMAEEGRICTEFSQYVRKEAEWQGCKEPLLVHWANAEQWWWEGALERHPRKSKRYGWISKEIQADEPNWFDLLKLFKEEPIVLKGCFGFGLKSVAKTLHKHGCIETVWDEGSSCLDGRGAMVGAWKAHKEAKRRGIGMRQLPEMKEICKYNEVDVKTLCEIISYLRREHVQLIEKSTGESEVFN